MSVGRCCQSRSKIQESNPELGVGESLAGVPFPNKPLGSELITGTMGGLILSGWSGTPADRRHRAPELLATAGEAELRRNGGLINRSPSGNAFTYTCAHSLTTTYEHLDPRNRDKHTALVFQHTRNLDQIQATSHKHTPTMGSNLPCKSGDRIFLEGALHSTAPADNQHSRRRRGVTAQPGRAPGPAGTI